MTRYKQREPPFLTTEPWYTYLGSKISPSVELKSHHTSATSTSTSLSLALPASETLVLLGVHLKSTDIVPDLQSWERWLHQSAPNDVESVVAICKRKIKDIIVLQATYESHSSLMLITIPMCFWNRLPETMAYQFISYVTSDNLVRSQQLGV